MLTFRNQCFAGINVISNYRYLILSVFLLFKITITATNGLLYGDFWEHSAVVNAFIEMPFNSRHPILDLNASHAFYSPYHWLVAIFSRSTNLSAINALSFFSVLNFIIFAFGLNLYSKCLTPNKVTFTSFYALLFILFLWGTRPWGFSGFFHFHVLIDVLPYPSTFATSISLICLSIGFELNHRRSIFKQLIILLICIVVLLSHPLTFIFLASGLLCQSVANHKRLSIIYTLISIAIATLIAVQWPYFSIISLLTGAGDVYHDSNQIMYSDVLTKIWPIVVLSPLLWLVFKNKLTYPIFLHLAFLIAVYLFGWFTSKYSYGRDITFIMILVQILLASQFSHFETQLSKFYPLSITAYRVFLGFILLYLASSWLYPTFTRSLTVLNSIVLGRTVSNQNTYKNLTFLPQYIHKDSVVFSDLNSSWLVPSFGGKVIGALHVQAFVTDDEQRRIDLLDFFAKDVTTAKRQSIIQKYKPDYFLIDKLAIKEWEEILNQVESFSKTSKIFENDQYFLFRFD